jgi:Bacterial archaeo-eukaryotic release factor family 3
VPVHHCPLCPLIFESRSEVQTHLRDEHRSRPNDDAGLRAEVAAAHVTLDWAQLRALISTPDSPSISLLLATTSAPSMTDDDVTRLRRLADMARHRLSDTPDYDPSVGALEHRLSRAVAEAEGSPTDRGLGIFVNAQEIAILTLPLEPRERAVVDSIFAIREFEYALRRYPVCRVLVLGRHPRVLEGRGRDLSEPITAGPLATRHRNASASDEQNLDALLEFYVGSRGDLPLVVVGDRRQLTAFRQHSRYARRITAEVRRSRVRAVPVGDLAQEAMRAWFQADQERTKRELMKFDALHRVTWGLTATWYAVATRTAERIWVEHDFALSGRVVMPTDRPGREMVEILADGNQPGAVDDLVNALVTRAHQQGIPVTLLEPAALNCGEPVAAQVPLAGRRENHLQRC